MTAVYTGDYELRRMDALFSRQPSGGAPQDDAVCTFDFVNLTGGVPDATWTTADYAQVETAWNTFWSNMVSSYSASLKCKELRWYANGPAFKPHGTTSAPLLRLTPVNVPGTASGGMLPPQIALTVTEVTAAHYTVPPEHGHPGQLRHRWGRWYMPSPAINAAAGTGSQDGRPASALASSLSSNAKTFYNACRGGNNLIPVVYSPTTGNAYSVDSLHVDDIWDVIRRRRFDTPTTRNDTGPLDPVTGG